VRPARPRWIFGLLVRLGSLPYAVEQPPRPSGADCLPLVQGRTAAAPGPRAAACWPAARGARGAPPGARAPRPVTPAAGRARGRRRQAVLPERRAQRQVPAARGAQPGALHRGAEVQAADLAPGAPLPARRPLRGARPRPSPRPCSVGVRLCGSPGSSGAPLCESSDSVRAAARVCSPRSCDARRGARARPQDITPPERVRADPKCDREVAVYGYARGCNLKPGARVHLAGVGDFPARPRLARIG